MNDTIDDEFDDEEDRRRATVIRRARVEGVEVAYESALATCRDPLASAQAKASSQRTLLQIGGMLDRHDRNSDQQKPIHEMDGNELNAMVAAAKRKRDRLAVAQRGQDGSQRKGSAFD
ncbi:hypothetical protein N7E70_007160 [Aminobacter sp. NyZ550]|uniref:hypothetical protein n=1 Tax=Aminobacter sp. NyZ550 TaxID=2979870 RepID=UPI0021D5CF93|nr:hypothetical protein [Aminobacter sp. NyZ550]WAX96633.1 hypothetical protein N7E70_007160 [Aminobacter sp. NyZ550]